MVSIKIARAGGGNSMMMGRRTVWIRRVTGTEVYNWWKGELEDLSHDICCLLCPHIQLPIGIR